mmetsp:Transcript_19015/g.60394  ORF Transcript_19015/g.60394 Transcript_19015/m.60394 type:complete len:85 (-) Transcript_19015:52-306(-)
MWWEQFGSQCASVEEARWLLCFAMVQNAIQTSCWTPLGCQLRGLSLIQAKQVSSWAFDVLRPLLVYCPFSNLGFTTILVTAAGH